MTSMTDLVEDWASLMRDRSPAKRFFDPDHVLDLLYGSDTVGRAVFVLVTTAEPRDTTVSRDVSVAKAQRTDGLWTMALTLHQPTLFNSFSRLCLDLVARSGAASTEKAALKALFGALDEWKLLLRKHTVRRLTLSELRGLVCGLWFGFRVLAPDRDGITVASAWNGPLGAPQDFAFLDEHLCEVKARRPRAATVGIPSLEQLDPGHRPMTLAVVTLEDCDADSVDAFTLIELLSEVRTRDDLDFASRSRLDQLVQSLGVDEQDSYYRETFFSVVGYQEFTVGPQFPSIRHQTVAGLPVSNVRYELAIDPLAPFLIRDVSFRTQEDPKND